MPSESFPSAVLVFLNEGNIHILDGTIIFYKVLLAVYLAYVLLLGRKVMINLDSILKSRDITLLTKVRIVKAMVFPVVMYGCESWTVKRLSTKELMLLNCGVGEDS